MRPMAIDLAITTTSSAGLAAQNVVLALVGKLLLQLVLGKLQWNLFAGKSS